MRRNRAVVPANVGSRSLEKGAALDVVMSDALRASTQVVKVALRLLDVIIAICGCVVSHTDV
jgi:hypothetical protein